MAKEKNIGKELGTELESVPPGKKASKNGKGKIIGLLLLICIIGALVAILGFNAFNIREKYLKNTLKNIPIIKNLLTQMPQEDALEVVTQEQLQVKITELEKLISDNENTIEILSNNNNELELENKRLKEIEAQQLEFIKAKEEFNALIALNDPTAYSAFYEQIAPENAANLYMAAKLSAEEKKELAKYTSSFDTMPADAVAGVMEEMVGTDIDLVVLILKNIDSEQSGKILAEMDTVKAAIVVKRLAPVLTTTN